MYLIFSKLRLSGLSLVCMLVSIALCFFSCSDDDDPKDTTPPDVSFANLTDNASVWNTVPIQITAEGTEDIQTIEVFIDGDLVSTITQTPYETEWDSNTVTDGNHTVKIVVTDKTGNKTEKEITLTVKNVLVTIDIPSDHLIDDDEPYNTRGVIFLSDENGNLIASEEYENGQRLEIRAPQFTYEKFYLTEVLILNEDSEEERVRLTTFADIERGDNWVLMASREIEENEEYAGQADLSFTNISSSSYYRLYTNGDNTDVDEFNTTASPRLHFSPSKLYVMKHGEDETEDPQFGMFSNIVAGSNSPIDLSQVNHEVTKVIITPPADAWTSVEVTAFDDPSYPAERYDLGSFYGYNNDFNVYYPGDAFAAYYFETFIESNSMYYSRGSRTESNNLSIPTHTKTVQPTENGFTYSASGEIDFFGISTFHPDETGYWFFVLPLASERAVPALQIPERLSNLSVPLFSQLESYRYLVFDSDQTSNYEELIEFIRTSDYSVGELILPGKEYVEITFLEDAAESNGRMKPKSKREGLFLRTFSNLR